jgi:undecaprenyl-diphosphatase
MMDVLINLDKQLFFFLNGLHTPWLDQIMFWISDKLIWVPFYAVLVGWIIKTYKWKSVVFFVAIALTITCTDQLISGFMKGYFERWRPSRDPAFEGLVHIVNDYSGGSFGFASSHSGNSYALAIIIFMLFREYKWIWLMFVWATVVAYSRVYLGVHYPGDVLVGGIIGLIFGKLFYEIANWTIVKYWKV